MSHSIKEGWKAIKGREGKRKGVKRRKREKEEGDKGRAEEGKKKKNIGELKGIRQPNVHVTGVTESIKQSKTKKF